MHFSSLGCTANHFPIAGCLTSESVGFLDPDLKFIIKITGYGIKLEGI